LRDGLVLATVAACALANGFMDPIEPALKDQGFVFRPGDAMRAWLGPAWTD